MQLFSIENLSLAAEATAVLLLLAFAWPEKQTAADSDETDCEQTDWEPAKSFCLQACIYRGLYVQQCRLNASLSEPFVLKVCDTDDWKPPLPTPWQDRLTKCLNRNGLDSILKGWLEIEVKHREGSCLSMLTLNGYSELVGTHGAMVTEQALQAIANQLSKSLSKDCIVARYLPDRFVILHLGSRLPACRKTMGTLQSCITDPNFFAIAGEPLSIACIVSMASIDSHSDIAVSIDELDEGMVEAERSAKNILAKLDGQWVEVVDCEPTLEESKTPVVAQDNSKRSAATTETNATAATTAPAETSAEPAIASASTTASSDSQDEKPAQSSKSVPSPVEAESTNDISAVANSDDIAALFAQINSNKSATSASPSKASAPATPAIVADANSTDVASADDIAALFNSVKAKGTPSSTPPAPEASSPTANAPAKVAPANADDGLDQSASKDDIASLFASVKPTSKTSDSTPNQATAPAPEVDLSSNASADDIASLFASAKPAAKATEPKVPVAEALATPTEPPKPSAAPAPTPAAAVDLSSNASADDIASLFASTKPTAKATATEAPAAEALKPPIEPPKQSSAPATTPAPTPATEVDLSSNASADDIASLFASTKPTATSAKAEAPITEIAANPIEPMAPSVAAAPEVNLTESASADDIASLFASVKTAIRKPAPETPSAPVAAADHDSVATQDDIAALFSSVKSAVKTETTTVPTQTAQPPIANEQLGEIATADDIAMLFQTVKKAEAHSEQKAAPVKAATPAEDLTANASLDDIEALFASIKK